MITSLGTMSVGAALTSTASASAGVQALAVPALAELTNPEGTGKIDFYSLFLVPSPPVNLAASLTQAGVNLTADLATVSAIPAVGAGWAAQITAMLVAIQALREQDPAIGARIDADVSAVAGLNVQMSHGVSGPNVNLTLLAFQLAALQAKKALLDAQVALAGELNASLEVSGLRLYRFDGDIATAGADLQARITSDGLTGEFHFVVLLPTNASAWSALQATVRTS